MAGLSLEIVTPEGSKLREQVDEFTAPSIAGEFGVLPGHLPILAAVRTGIISWRKGGSTSSCAVGWGFIEVSQNHAYVLTDRFIAKDQVDPVSVRAEIKTLDSKIDKYPGKTTDAEYERLVNEELWCAAQLELHGDPPPPTVAFVSPYSRAPETEEGLTDENAPAPSVADEHELARARRVSGLSAAGRGGQGSRPPPRLFSPRASVKARPARRAARAGGRPPLTLAAAARLGAGMAWFGKRPWNLLYLLIDRA